MYCAKTLCNLHFVFLFIWYLIINYEKIVLEVLFFFNVFIMYFQSHFSVFAFRRPAPQVLVYWSWSERQAALNPVHLSHHLMQSSFFGIFLTTCLFFPGNDDTVCSLRRHCADVRLSVCVCVCLSPERPSATFRREPSTLPGLTSPSPQGKGKKNKQQQNTGGETQRQELH